jgi:hypothetical protein
VRRKLKRFLIDAHCRGALPDWVVAAAFKLFRLKHV